jgi:hypothetical protein
MNKRMIASIILACIVMVEVLLFINQDTPMKIIPKAKPTGGLFGNTTTIVDADKQSATNTKYLTVIGSTILVGGLIIISLPKGKSKDTEG